MRSTFKTERIPILALSANPAKALAKARDDGSMVVPWPNRIEDLTREIEAALDSAKSGNGQGALHLRLRPTRLLSFRESPLPAGG